MCEQIAAIRCHLGRHERVVHDVGQDAVHRLASHTDLSGVLRVEGPLRPELREHDDGRQTNRDQHRQPGDRVLPWLVDVMCHPRVMEWR